MMLAVQDYTDSLRAKLTDETSSDEAIDEDFEIQEAANSSQDT